MQAFEQVLLQFVYLFWVLVVGFFLVAAQSGRPESSSNVIPVTGQSASDEETD